MMKGKYINIVLFLVVVIGLNTVFHYLYKHKIFYYTDNPTKERQLSAFTGNLKYLFLGDSRSQNAINPTIIGNSFNYSASNENYIQTYYKLKGVIDKLQKKPESIVLLIDPSCFSSFRITRFIYPSEFLTFNDYLEISLVTKKIAYMGIWVQNKFFMYTGSHNTISNISVSEHTNNSLGYVGRKGSLLKSKDIPTVCRRQAELYLKNRDPFDPILQIYFEKILAYCDRMDIKVILMKTPMAKLYIEACNSLFSLHNYYNTIDSIAKGYSSVKYVYDFQDMFFDKPGYFRNPDHLNIRGATFFSNHLKEELKNLEAHDHTFQ